MRIYVKGRGLIDEASSPESGTKVLPGMEADLRDIQKWKGHWDEVMAQGGKPGGSGPIRWVARMPKAIWGLWTADDPDVAFNKKKFFDKLDQHPYYAVYNRKTRRSGG